MSTVIISIVIVKVYDSKIIPNRMQSIYLFIEYLHV